MAGGAADLLRILVATDTHVGYKERDKIRGDDSFVTLEEILQIGKNEDVDFVLHGGDLYDENKPSRPCMNRVSSLLRKYTVGEGGVYFEVLNSDDRRVFPTGQVTHEDPNLNIETPVFIVHGNHDDPSGDNNLSALDLLSTASLVNYFGKSEDLDNINVYPVLLRKGQTKVALYGLGNIRDERLHRAFSNVQVKFHVPKRSVAVDNDMGVDGSSDGQEPGASEWFNLMVIHQNRYKGHGGGSTSKNCIHEAQLPQFLDLVIWCHEHDCLIDPVDSAQSHFHVVQPGSSVATSLAAGEALPKHVAILEISGENFRVVPKRLKTVRPFEFQEVSLSDEGELDPSDEEGIIALLSQTVEALIERTHKRQQEDQDEEPGGEARDPMLPLIRLKVEHSGYPTISNQRFGQQFVGKVANPDDILLFHKSRRANKDAASSTVRARRNKAIPNLVIEDTEDADGKEIQDIIFTYIEKEGFLDILSEPQLNLAIQDYVLKMETSAIDKFVGIMLDKTRSQIKPQLSTDAQKVRDDIIQLAKQHAQKVRADRVGGNDQQQGVGAAADDQSSSGAAPRGGMDIDQEADDDDDGEHVARPKTKAKAKAKGKTKAKAKGKAKSKPKLRQAKLSEWNNKKRRRDEDEEDLDDISENNDDMDDDEGDVPAARQWSRRR
ncbi:unnamed protein product [Vitrella brassicaformis CCMP3155]|uniref:Double-strand break repair protein n=3 Tax=Vitrella brassicaformis TaxID=1169539 RepID=A0A0G4ECL7_VITBC|nr:unnamed protein product [Vitrella brassicaformis CCMP3155]|eukprot:CEL93287.1 unnamed protein product [Vitrella brassicaformis CCMP3155]